MVDYFQNSIADPAVATPGLVVREALADIESGMAVEPAAGIGLGLVLERGTDPEKQVDLGGDASAVIVGISCRVAARVGIVGEEATNLVKYSQKQPCPFIRSGYVWAEVTGTGSAGSRAVAYNDTTGAVVLGTAGAGETQLDPDTVELCNTVGAGETLALLRLNDLRGSGV